MYKSFQSLYEDCQSLSSDDDAASLAFFKTKLNEGISKCYAVLNAEYFYASATDATVDGQSSYPLPYNCGKVHSLKVAVSPTEKYVTLEFPGDENSWIALTESGTSESAYPTYFFVKRDTYEIYPASSTDSYTMTIRYQLIPTQLTADDSATSTIKTLANAGTTVTSNAAAFTAAMVDRMFRIDADYNWYRIASYTSTTVIELAREYAGTAIAAGTSTYTIGEMSMIPEPYQDAPIDYALFMYYLLKKKPDLAGIYKTSFEEYLMKIKTYGGNLTTSGILQENIVIQDPNDWPVSLS